MLALIIAAGMAASGSTAADVPQQTKAAKPDKMICKSFPKTESRVGVNRVCKRRSEWEHTQREQELELDQIKVDNTMMQPSVPLTGGPN